MSVRPQRAILLVDHGSRHQEAGDTLAQTAELVAERLGPTIPVRYAHLTLASPSVDEAFASCVAAGATEVIVVPYFLSAGQHVTRDLPRALDEAARRHPATRHRLTAPLAGDPLLVQIIVARCAGPVKDRPCG